MSSIILGNESFDRTRRVSRLGGFRHLMREWWQRLRSRYELETLGEAGLRDIGMSSAEGVFEASKPFWKA